MEIDSVVVGGALLGAGAAVGHYVTLGHLAHRAVMHINAVKAYSMRVQNAVVDCCYSIVQENMGRQEFADRIRAAAKIRHNLDIILLIPEKEDGGNEAGKAR